ncbi:hypothetical protein H4R34_001882 [Dimargaris verticillata]|uniref:CENP-T/Histone H4 histone fold domain-containing protein n=1 Tax=Dimargaris verticillata TaxID=2761393 RepID=A0A9W8B3T3_9FUNG|nr:hypothetical protein H4R34_001882 [Dimargaris verticillata]
MAEPASRKRRQRIVASPNTIFNMLTAGDAQQPTASQGQASPVTPVRPPPKTAPRPRRGAYTRETVSPLVMRTPKTPRSVRRIAHPTGLDSTLRLTRSALRLKNANLVDPLAVASGQAQVSPSTRVTQRSHPNPAATVRTGDTPSTLLKVLAETMANQQQSQPTAQQPSDDKSTSQPNGQSTPRGPQPIMLPRSGTEGKATPRTSAMQTPRRLIRGPDANLKTLMRSTARRHTLRTPSQSGHPTSLRGRLSSHVGQRVRPLLPPPSQGPAGITTTQTVRANDTPSDLLRLLSRMPDERPKLPAAINVSAARSSFRTRDSLSSIASSFDTSVSTVPSSQTTPAPLVDVGPVEQQRKNRSRLLSDYEVDYPLSLAADTPDLSTLSPIDHATPLASFAQDSVHDFVQQPSFNAESVFNPSPLPGTPNMDYTLPLGARQTPTLLLDHDLVEYDSRMLPSASVSSGDTTHMIMDYDMLFDENEDLESSGYAATNASMSRAQTPKSQQVPSIGRFSVSPLPNVEDIAMSFSSTDDSVVDHNRPLSMTDPDDTGIMAPESAPPINDATDHIDWDSVDGDADFNQTNPDETHSLAPGTAFSPILAPVPQGSSDPTIDSANSHLQKPPLPPNAIRARIQSKELLAQPSHTTSTKRQARPKLHRYSRQGQLIPAFSPGFLLANLKLFLPNTRSTATQPMLAALHEITHAYFEQAAEDLVAYAEHRKSHRAIDESDVACLFQRQRLAPTKRRSLRSLAMQLLPRELTNKVFPVAKAADDAEGSSRLPKV